MPRRDRIREQIEKFAERRIWVVRKACGGYSMHREDGWPIVRLKKAEEGSSRSSDGVAGSVGRRFGVIRSSPWNSKMPWT
jgi:hypothetical protein